MVYLFIKKLDKIGKYYNSIDVLKNIDKTHCHDFELRNQKQNSLSIHFYIIILIFTILLYNNNIPII